MKKYYKVLKIIGVLAICLIVSNAVYYRFDLTSEGRYTLSESTKCILANLPEDVYVEVYLDGDLPSSFVRLRERTNELLTEFSNYSNKKIYFHFRNPNSILDNKEKQGLINSLVKRGIQPTSINRRKSDESLSQQIVFPALMLWNSKKEMAVNLLKNNVNLPADLNINNSIESLEYELINAVNVVSQQNKKNIGFLSGHNEIPKVETADLGRSLADFYNVDLVDCDEISRDYNKYSALVISQPRKDFTEKDKLAIDQYIMHGGRCLWLIDQVDAHLDSLRYKSSIFAFFKPVNIEDMLFNYGVRINPNLVLDGQCVLIPVKTSLPGEAAKYSPAPWYYSPLVTPKSNHAIVKDINPVRFDFANTIDLVGNDSKVKKTVLLNSSEYSRQLQVPCPVSLEIVQEKVDPKVFNKRNLIMSVLLEGKFQSVFKHRMVDGEKLDESSDTKMIVVADGDIIRNNVSGKGKNLRIYPLGYDRFSKRTYGNKAFLMNAINYLCDNKGLMNLRAREYKLRILNKSKVKEDRSYWQYINILLPLLIILISAIIYRIYRKKKYS